MATHAHLKALPFLHELHDFQPCSPECSTLSTGTCNQCCLTLDMYSSSPLRHCRKIIRATFNPEPSSDDLTIATRIAERIKAQPNALGHPLPQPEPASASKSRHLSSRGRPTDRTKRCTREHLDSHSCPQPQQCDLKHLDDHTCKPCQDDHLSDHSCPVLPPCSSPHLSAHSCDPCPHEHLLDHTCSPCELDHLRDHSCPKSREITKPCKQLHLDDITPQQAQEIYGLIDPDDVPTPTTELTPDLYANSPLRVNIEGLLTSSALTDLFQSNARPPPSILLAVNSLRQQLLALSHLHEDMTDTATSLPPLSFPDSEPDEPTPSLSQAPPPLAPTTMAASSKHKTDERLSSHDKRGRPPTTGFFSLLAPKPQLDTRKRKDSVQSQPASHADDSPTQRSKRSSSVISSRSRAPVPPDADDNEDSKSLLRQKLEQLESNVSLNRVTPSLPVSPSDPHRRPSSHLVPSQLAGNTSSQPTSQPPTDVNLRRGSLEYHKAYHDKRHASSRCHHCAREFNVEQF